MRRISDEELEELRKRGMTHSMHHLLISYQTLADVFVDKTKDLLELKPIDMIIHCPKCKKQHIDRPDEPGICECGDEEDRHKYDFDGRFKYCETRHGSNNSECECPGFKVSTWTNPPHKSHTCRIDDGGCGIIFRIADDVPTNGVAEIKTRGEKDTWPKQQ
ncbi:MAG: hypothetical protein ABL984_05355 [Pyrinomonadaceae bacterium]